jgi:hypothetical protein
MDLTLLRRRCEARIEGWELPVPFDVHQLCRALAEQRQRPIVLRPLLGRDGPCGLWVAGPSSDFIFYDAQTSPLHQQHIILHEISHLLCGHRARPLGEGELRALLFPDLCPRMVERVLQRAGYATDDEQEAELLASVILQRVTARDPARSEARPELVGLHRRLVACLGDGTGTSAC